MSVPKITDFTDQSTRAGARMGERGKSPTSPTSPIDGLSSNGRLLRTLLAVWPGTAFDGASIGGAVETRHELIEAMSFLDMRLTRQGRLSNGSAARIRKWLKARSVDDLNDGLRDVEGLRLVRDDWGWVKVYAIG